MRAAQNRVARERKLCPLRPQTLAIQSQLEQWTKSGRKHWDLYRHLFNPYLLADATKLVLDNRGSAGVDEVTCAQVRKMGWSFIKKLSEKLKTRTYRPVAVRRVYIPKGDGRKRPLGIPSLEDRVVQRALMLLLEPIYEQIFLPCSWGFRPEKRAVDCVAAAAKKIFSHRFVIDADIEDFFGNVSHNKLDGMLKEQIVDPRVLNLIRLILKSPVQEAEGRVEVPKKGTPQGGPLSPLLANIYLHHVLDQKVHEVMKDCPKRFELYRYADDFIVACRSRHELQFIGRLMRGWLREGGLNLHPSKTRAIDMTNENRGYKSKFDFLGYKFHLRAFSDNPKRFWVARQPSEKARLKLRASIKAGLQPGLSKEIAKKRLEQIWYGWSHYFKYGNSNRIFYREIDNINRMVNVYLRKKYRHQRRPVPWRKLHPIREYMTQGIKPVSVIPTTSLQRRT